ncbi:hypothetical protein SAMN05660479_02001 [Microbulbifer thermotolerans]|uniref:hypothetical protein n=1 Tax=Microbulbifer thermotolerans TaxID=252514 RepID=UPI0008F067CE|nr:hypothetical protein [Microbulbifer thermotolerans]SFC58457.1 hypothetical protein SAMN05660479_02001 [Microbulbifer thermotolerans]
MKSKFLPVLPLALLLGGCSGFWNDLCGTPQFYTHSSIPVELAPAFPHECFTGDMPAAGPAMCIEEGVHCYELDNGDWCAGPYSPFALEPAYGMRAQDWSK